MVGYIYLIECVTDYEQTYKIGFSKNKNIEKRLINLRTGNPGTLKIIDVFETKHNRRVETALHSKFNSKRKKGEWFEMDIDDVANFQKICENIEEGFDILKQHNNPFY